MKVVIAEKPSVAMDLAKSLGSNVKRHDGYVIVDNYCITWAVGHLVEIDEEIAPRQWRTDTLPILPEDFKYKITSDKIKQFNVIKRLVQKTDCVVIATDAGREGELIARLILELSDYKGQVERFWTSEALTEEVVKREFNKLKDGKEFESLYYSALGRQHADWVLGINMTRLATINANDRSVWSIGRVQTPVLKLIVERELEIVNFEPEPYWVLKAEFSKEDKIYNGTLLNKGNSTSFTNKEEIEKILLEIEKENKGIISKVTKTEKKQKPPLLHSLTTLQREANQLHGYSAKKTLDLAQELYEAKKISYPRTDAQHLDEQKETKDLVKRVLTKLRKESLLKQVDKVGKRVFNKKKLTDHYAIIPQDLLSKKQLGDKLTEEHFNIYVLIARRLTGTFMEDYLYETTSIITNVKDFKFVSKGKIDIQLGWKELYRKDKETDKDDEDQSLPDVKKSDEVEKISQKIDSKLTKPPERYKESSILGVMEKLNLGTPATRAGILETLKHREYLKLSKKNLIPYEKGINLIKNIGEKNFTNPEMTAEWENELDNIYKGKKGSEGYRNFLQKMKGFVKEEIDELKEIKFELSTNKKCEKCNEKDLEDSEKFFKCLVCESVIWKNFLGKTITKKMAINLLDGKEIEFKDLISKQGNKFDAKARFINGKIDLIFGGDYETIGNCSCKGEIADLPKLYKCLNCGKIVWKKFLEKELSNEEALKLLNDEIILLNGLKSKAGNVFNAKAKLENSKIKLFFD